MRTWANFLVSRLDAGPIELPQDGTYTLVVDAYGTATPTYQFQLWDVPAPDVQTIQIGDVANGSIETPGVIDHWFFDATPGQLVFFDFQSISAGTLETWLYAPDGSLLQRKANFQVNALDAGPIELPQAGTYEFVVDAWGQATPTYQFQLWDVPPDIPRPLPLNTPVADTTAPRQTITYVFSGTAGQELVLDVTQNDQNVLGFTLLDPGGTTVLNNKKTDAILPPLPADGTYQLIVRPANAASDDPGAFTFRLQEVVVPTSGRVDSRGSDFWLAFPCGANELGRHPDLSLFVTSDVDTSGIVTIPSLGQVVVFDLSAGQLAAIDLPNSLQMAVWNDRTESKGVRVTAADEVAVYGLSRELYSTDAYLALPTDILGTESIVLGYENTADPSQFVVLGTADGTTVTITPSDVAGSHPQGVPYNVTLNRGQAYQLYSTSGTGGDLSGAIVQADQPVAVFGGARCANVPRGYGACDHLLEQLPPVETWGQHFVTMPLATRIGGDTFRILAAEADTHVAINGQLVATLDRGQFHQQLIDGPAEITATGPVLVAQYSNGTSFDGVTSDPFMMLVPPFEQFQASYTVTALTDTHFERQFINITTASEAVGTIELDGVPIPAEEFVPIGSSRFVGAQLEVSPEAHQLVGNEPFGVFVYGFGNFDSYGYPGGMSLAPVAMVSSLDLQPPVASVPFGAEHLVTATVSDQFGAPLEGIRVDFDVSGNHPQTGFDFTDGSGQADYAYVGTIAGTDTVEATVGELTATATVDWIAAPPTIYVDAPAQGSSFDAGDTVLVTGRALPGPSQAAIVAVTVDDVAVDSVDAAGNFFATVSVEQGQNQFAFIAVDGFGQSAAETLTLEGVTPSGSVNADQLQDITTTGTVAYRATTFNRTTRTLHTDVRLTNVGQDSLSAPVLAVYDPVRPLSVDLGNADGVLDDDRPYVAFDAELPPNGLAAGATSDPIRLAFDNAGRSRFDFDVTLLTPGNTPPRFTSAPVTEAVSGVAYRYAAAATDAEGDSLSFALAIAPEGMTIDAASGVVSWSPTASDEGVHQVEVKVSDGRGGTARQSFALQTGHTPTNRPPRFQSAPPTEIGTGEDYTYAPEVVDPDGDVISFRLDAGPAGASINATTGHVAFRNAAFGVYDFSIRADDGQGGSAVQTYVLAVGGAAATSGLPQIVSTPPTEAVVDSLYVYLVQAEDPEDDPLTFTLLDSPAAMQIDPATGRVDWTPTLDQVGFHAVLLVSDDGHGGIASQSFAVVVSEFPPNAPPTVTSTPSTIATEDQAYTYDVTALDPDGDPLTFQLTGGPSGMSVDSLTGQVTWTPSPADLGPHTVEIRVSDPLDGVAFQRFELDARDANTAPQFTSEPITPIHVGDAYRYDVSAVDSEDEVTFALVSSPANMGINPRSGLVFSKTELPDVGDHSIVIRATDERGVSSDQAYTLTVLPDTRPPLVSVLLSTTLIDLGQPVRIDVRANDDVQVASVWLEVDGAQVTLDVNGTAFYTATHAGLPDITATAIDTIGNLGTGSPNPPLRVLDPSDNEPPFVDIASPTTQSIVSYLTDIVGTVTDDNLEFYRLEYSPANANQWRPIREIVYQPGPGGPGVVDDVLGVFDPTLLSNTTYDIRVFAQDTNGLQTIQRIQRSIEAGAKIGVNRQPSIDLVIPVAGGPPIEIHRTHSQETADRSGDFGNGWQFCTAEPDIRESVPRTPFEHLMGQFAALPFHDGDRVQITTPDCQRVGFTFSPVPHTGIWSEVSADFYDPRWIPDPGVDWRLYGENDFTRITGIASGEFDLDGLPVPLLQFQGQYIIAAVNASYNPLGYQLINKQGVRYHYHQEDGLRDVTDRNGNTLTYTDAAITSSSGQQVQFQRDSQGRITKVIDPDGNRIDYSYDAAGNLVDVQYPNGLSNSYRYTAENFLEAVNPDDRPEQEMITTGFEYDVAGRLAVVFDALGATNSFSYDLDANTRITFDALGFPTEMEYDDRGNMIREKSATNHEAFYEYDANDNLTKIIDERGFETTMTYDDRRNTTSVTDALGNVTTITYSDNNDVTQMVRADGAVHTYTVDDAGNTIRVQLPGGTDTTIEYDAQGRVIRATDVDGGVETLVYRDLPYPIRDIDRDGSSMQFTYDSRGKITSITDENGNVTTMNLDSRSRPESYVDALGGVISFEYSGGSQLTKHTDEVGDTTTHVYDANHRPLRITDAEGGVIQITYDENGRRRTITDKNGNTTAYAYRPDGRLESMTDAMEGVTSYEYDPTGNQTALIDPNGNRWQWEYDALGYTSAAVAPNGQRNDLEYDPMGNLIKETDSLGRVTQYVYNDLNLPAKIINAAGDEMLFTYDWETNLLSEQDFNGNVRAYEYDARNRLVKATDPLGNVVTYGYDAAGNRTTTTDERGHVYTVDYDALNRPIRWIDPKGAEIVRVFDANSRLVSSTDAGGAVVQFEYDALDRIVRQIDPLGGISTWAYDLQGNVTSAADELNRVTTYAYDDLNRTISVTDSRGGITQYGYDAKGNMISITDPIGNTTTQEYDSLHRLVKVTDELGNFATTAYDAVGNVSQIVDRNGRVTSFAYDNLDRLTTETWLDNGIAVNVLSYTYDSVGNVLTAGDNYSAYTYTYDALHRFISIDNASTPRLPNVILTQAFDAAGNRISLSDSAGVTISSRYDSRNQLSERIWNGGGVADASLQYTYDSRGLPTLITRYASLDDSNKVSSTTFDFDPKARLVELTHRDAFEATLVDYSYTRDLADQLVSETHHGLAHEYTRDATRQVLTAAINGVVDESYQYDLNGNRTSGGSVTAADNRLAEDDDYEYEYDAEGNLTKRTEKATSDYTEYTYDHRNRLVLVDDNSQGGILLASIAYTYDVHDRMITRSHDVDGAGPIAPEVRHTVYDGAHVWADYDASGNVTARYLFHDGVDQIAARWRPDEGTAWYLADHLGTVRDILDSNGNVANHITYDTYGLILSQDNPPFGDRFAFTGREWDEAAQLYYYRARFYDPVAGRFLSQDPIRFAAGDMNVYRYADNNPLDYTDPSGNLAMTECAFVRFASATVNMVCSSIQMLLKGEFKGKTFSEAGATTMNKVIFGGDFKATDADGNPLTGDALLAQSVERTMHFMNVASSVLPGGSGLALQLVMKAITIGTTAKAVAHYVSNPHLFNIMALAETWVRGAYAAVQDPKATFHDAIDAYKKKPTVEKALLWSEIVCGAANLALMVYSARARCFVAGTPVVIAVLPPPPSGTRPADRAEHHGLTYLDMIAGVALVSAVVIRQRRRKQQKVYLFADERDLFFSRYAMDENNDIVPTVPEKEANS